MWTHFIVKILAITVFLRFIDGIAANCGSHSGNGRVQGALFFFREKKALKVCLSENIEIFDEQHASSNYKLLANY